MEYLRFGDIYSIPSSNGLSRPSAVRGSGYKMVNMGELFSNGIINDIPMERVQMSEKELSKFLLQKGDLLFARQSLVAEGAGKCSYVNNLSEKTTFESHLIRVRLNPQRAISKYYYYLFQLPNNPIKAIVNQCAQAGIRGSELVRVKVPCPGIDVQEKIASILSAYDSQIENNQKRIKLLEQMAENIYKEWFVRFRFPGYENAEYEGGVPKGWTVAKLDHCVEVCYGKDHKKIEDGDIPIFGSGGVMRYGNKALFDGESVLIPRKGSLNNVMYYKGKAWTVDTMFYTKMLHPYLAKYLYYTLSGIDLASFNSGAALPSMTTDILYHFKIVRPNEKILKMFDEYLCPIYDEIDFLNQQNNLLITQRDLLLPRLMSGKLSI